MSYERVIKIRRVGKEQLQAQYQHDVGTLITDNVLRNELLYTSIGFYKDSNKATRFLQLSFGTKEDLEAAEAKLTQSDYNFHWMDPTDSEWKEMTNVHIFWKLLDCFPDGAPFVYTE